MNINCKDCSLPHLVERVEELEQQLAAAKLYAPAQKATPMINAAPIGETNFEYFGVTECEKD